MMGKKFAQFAAKDARPRFLRWSAKVAPRNTDINEVLSTKDVSEIVNSFIMHSIILVWFC